MELRGLSESGTLTRTAEQLGITNYGAVRFAHMLVFETLRRQNLIDEFVNSVLKPDFLSELDSKIRAFLRLYVYQTRIVNKWSDVNFREAEKITRLVRSILGWRNLQKVEPVLGLLLMENSTVILRGVRDEVRIGFETFHPCWFVEYCFRLFGRNEAIAMLKANIKPPPTYLRVNTLKAEESAILKKIGEEGVEVEEVQNSRYIYEVKSAKHLLTRTESFREGFFCIQDKTSGFAVEAANPKSGMTVLDLCSAPGVKTTHLAQLMRNRGAILSLDCSRRRMAIWTREVVRTGVDITLPIIADIRRRLPVTLKADLLVLDPPCTSTGVLGKLPSYKWKLEPYSITRMAEIQWEMINNTAEYVKAKGVLIYSTCSITIEENEMIVERFLKWHPEFSLVEIMPNTGCPGLRGLDKCRRFYPHLHECAGFFIAKLLRNDDACA